MEKERDVRLVRFDLRLRVGADGDPLDNQLHEAWSSLPENTVIRNDWLRRRLLLGHILEREGLTELLSVIGRLGGGQQHVAPAQQHQSEPAAPAAPAATATVTAVADFLPPVMDEPVAPVASKPTAKKQLGGLLPSIAPAPRKDEPESEDNSKSAEKESKKTAIAEKTAKPTSAKKTVGEADKTTPVTPHSKPVEEAEQLSPPAEKVEKVRPTLAGDRG